MPELDKKYRPKTWNEFIGNEPIKEALQKKIESDSLPRRIMFSGQRGIGKCIDKNSYLPTEEGLKRITYFSNGENGFHEYKISLISKDSIEETSHFFEESSDRTIKVTNLLGIDIRGTYEHKILILDKNLNFTFKRLDEIEVGDYSCINRKLSFFPKNYVKLEFKQDKKPNDSNSKKLINLPNIIDENIAIILGYVTANSSQNTTSLNFSSNNMIFKEELRSILSLYGIDISPNYIKKDFTLGGIWFSRFINQLFESDKLPTARYKHVPRSILESPEKVQAAFLRPLIDCDGYYGNGVIEYCTASERLAREVQLMLLNFGIISRKSKKFLNKYNHTYYRIWISSKDLDIYMEKIGSNKFSIDRKRRNTNNDIIPYIKIYLKDKREEIRKFFNVKKSGGYYFNDKFLRFGCHNASLCNSLNITYDKLEKFRNSLSSIPEIDMVKELRNFCNIFLDNFFFFSPIKKIEEIEEKIKVYDFTVPKSHNFVCNGYINHNTTLSRLIANSFNVPYFQEINMGTDRGVKDMEDFLLKMKRPWLLSKDECQKRFYILDEIHNCSVKAQNALLKDSEEPPEDVFLICCTTEPEKIIGTIRSRFTQYKLQPLSNVEVLNLLGRVCREEEWNHVSLKVLKKIAVSSEGCPREALIMLDMISDSDEESALDIISFGVKETEIRDICAALGNVKDSNPWTSVQEKLRNYKGDAEAARRAILGWFRSIILNPKNNGGVAFNRAIKIYPNFLNTFYHSGIDGLVEACYTSCCDIRNE